MSEAEERHEGLLWEGPISYPAPVLAHTLVEDGFMMELGLDDSAARADDAFWARVVRRWHGWQAVTDWWVARRWVKPRDITRE